MDKNEEQFIKQELLLRDYLASERTMMSVDRTFLAYIRTSLTLFIAGISFIKFFDSYIIQVLGWLLIPVAIFTFVLGVHRSMEMTTIINERAKENGYRVDSPSSIVRQPLYTLTNFLRDTLRAIYRSFLPATHHHERRS
ncbi:hypothetical protein A3C98_05330 [Candidatus Roizmanbacteria bacterium RIFCSPHIGHO2_02_FULL_37_15]|uniref:DUF202 domain-containing protein n=1 Tax=Candidatus Roizmanbacteria bacterium RIFCSPLOWO2_01_FULL_37_16 TaxID=1802058 RepID=A0A1F7ILL8_9BACT|nr:MAG: hypothetical protein A2859_03985 [Candidatus Roizmanbacteria bacterium RIFCSPHIGHO2_01_FULL_37_16b]OGK22352.1 MAG: hypothetical protein A3C98_05330 [Candidatus Roizmanbacteria bacterium RIFCSPHIGHO2_02_FULL_37_15]OGK33676.1 MAG: hypothetical protein A3F57_04500 [Candidatus Roizmanbacteria bacterium RIFCSPHIGHO2_12_FULL_36_11]OGK44170.1 MAG: hypothetical protein A3B40_04835 [Candidatus Roizmanbacteria bacterium RIFCSPLOWO2_01_FULL_37_16]OGK57447.1 MAG: hypothetical protein A3I50_03160 [C